MISAPLAGGCPLAVRGDDACEPESARLLVGRSVSVMFDCDRGGAARRPGGSRAIWDAAAARGSIDLRARPPMTATT